jgi:MFS family permease
MIKPSAIKSDIGPRLDRLPWTAWHVRVVFALGFAWLLDSLEASIIGSVLGILKKVWVFTPMEGSLTVSIWLIGIMVGAVGFGYLSDKLGRKPMFILTLLWYAGFTVACAFSANIWMFIFFRFMAAVGIGGEYSAISSAVVEFVPKRNRGRVNAFCMSMWPVGAIASSLVVIFALQLFPPEIAWRAGFLIAVVLAVFALVIRKFLPESPRWLISQRRFEEAEAIVQDVENYVKETKGLKELPPATAITITPKVYSTWDQTKELFRKYPGRVALGAAMNFSQVALGYGSIAYASVVLFPSTNTPASDVPFYMMLAFIFAFFGGMSSMLMVDSVGRKGTALLSQASFPIAALSMIFVHNTTTAVISLCIMQFCYTWGWITEYVIKSEIFPTHSRASGIGWATFFGRLGGVIAPPILAGVYEATKSIEATAYTLAVLILPGFVASIFWALNGVEGKQMAVEDMIAQDRHEAVEDKMASRLAPGRP